MLTVLNRHHGNPKGQYIGRGTPLGNPFKVEKGRTRRQAIEQFRKWALNALTDQRHPFTVAAKELKTRHDAGEDIKLVCSCKPDACHGDIIVELIEEGLV